MPYQRLIWFLDSENVEKQSGTLPGMVQGAAHAYHQRLWRSSIYQNSLYQLTPSEDVIVSLILEVTMNRPAEMSFFLIRISVFLRVLLLFSKVLKHLYV